MIKSLSQLLVIALLFSVAQAQAQDANDSAMTALIKEAMQSDLRGEAEVERDRNRKPSATLEFFGLEPDMKVLELIPGGGWYTKLLAPALAERGELYVSLFTRRVEEGLMADNDRFGSIKVLKPEVTTKPGELPGTNDISEFDFGETGFDAVLTFRNMHNFSEDGRKNINKAVFKALKKGGVYGVVDHTRRHMEPHTQENRRRADPVQIIKELTALGFEFVDYSDLHYRADDELRFEVGRKSVTGNSDRFTLLFRKPK